MRQPSYSSRPLCAVAPESYFTPSHLPAHPPILFSQDQFDYSATTWVEQFKQAIKVNGGDEDPDSPVTSTTWLIHLLTLPFKLTFAFIPPAPIMDGKVRRVRGRHRAANE